jgi:hypothetical protein
MRYYFKLFVFLGCFACIGVKENKQEQVVQLDTLQWMTGRWEMQTDGGILSEEWRKINDSVYSGTSFMISGGDTLFSEKISLTRAGNELHYIPVVSGQNDGKPVIFRFTSAQGGQWVFENPAHDFPQQIIYAHPHPDSLVAVIMGNDKGKMRREEFRMKHKEEINH